MQRGYTLLALTLCGCIGSQATYIKDGIPQAQADLDSAECSQIAIQQVDAQYPAGTGTADALLLASLHQVEIGSRYGACLMSRGYRVQEHGGLSPQPGRPINEVATPSQPPTPVGFMGYQCLQEEAHKRGLDIERFGISFRRLSDESQLNAMRACERQSLSEIESIFAMQ